MSDYSRFERRLSEIEHQVQVMHRLRNQIRDDLSELIKPSDKLPDDISDFDYQIRDIASQVGIYHLEPHENGLIAWASSDLDC